MGDENKVVKDGASTTQEAGVNPTSEKSIQEQAEDILKEAGIIKTEEKKEPEKEESQKNGDNKDSGKEPEKKEELPKEENKVPLSRLNKVIEKVKNLEGELAITKEKLSREQQRIGALTEEEKEEQQTYKKLGIETKEDKLQDKIEELERLLKETQETAKGYEEEIRKDKIGKLSSRIEELSQKHNGSDGLPPFNIQELIEFGKTENYMPDDPLKLYNLKYQNEIMAQKYSKKAPEIDKGNKETFVPEKKTITSFTDPEFKKEAEAILKSITG